MLAGFHYTFSWHLQGPENWNLIMSCDKSVGEVVIQIFPTYLALRMRWRLVVLSRYRTSSLGAQALRRRLFRNMSIGLGLGISRSQSFSEQIQLISVFCWAVTSSSNFLYQQTRVECNQMVLFLLMLQSVEVKIGRPCHAISTMYSTNSHYAS